MPTLICDCNKTMPLDPRSLGQALGEQLTLHSTLCRREAGAFQQAVRGTDEVVVACTQEQRLFTELAQGTQGAVAPIRFVNIRETGGWSRDARAAQPKIAALLAAARLPAPEPVPAVSYRSQGRLLILGPLEQAERCADRLEDALDVTVFAAGGAAAQARRRPVLAGRILGLTGRLGDFRLDWTQDNPIDPDLCTRCNACVQACPEGAIGLDYQVNLQACRGHRACVRACQSAGAIDFQRTPREHDQVFDLVLDLRAEPAFRQHAPPQGYFHVPAGAGEGASPHGPQAGSRLPLADALLQLRNLVGEFEKPRFFQYRQKLCAHARNEKVGCNACVDLCSAEAIRSERERNQVRVDPHLCVGCGACATACPTGALTHVYPGPQELGRRVATLLQTYRRAGGQAPVLLLHSQGRGQALIEELGRSASVGAAHGLPARVIPLGLWHSASAGLDLWLSAVAHGAAQVLVLTTDEDAPQYCDALQQQLELAQRIVHGLGHAGTDLRLLRCAHPADLDQELSLLPRLAGPLGPAAGFAVQADKRASLELALDHLTAHGRVPEQPIALGPGAPWGSLALDRDRCTVCLSCVSACPAGALHDDPAAPRLAFTEANCVQCGLCVKTCPESALQLVPRLLPGPQRRQPRVLAETPPYGCIRCGRAFGTLKGVETLIARLAGHAMFQGAAAERLKMCADCRVVDIYTAGDETRITDR